MSVMDEWLMTVLYGPGKQYEYNMVEVELTFGNSGHTEIIVLSYN